MNQSIIFELYRNYAEAVREKAAEKIGRPIRHTLCEDDFVRVWMSLPKTERRRWEERFKAGLEQVILSESSEYTSVLANDNSAFLKVA